MLAAKTSTYHSMTVTRFATIITTRIQRKLSGITVVLNGLLIATGYVVVTPRTAFWEIEELAAVYSYVNDLRKPKLVDIPRYCNSLERCKKTTTGAPS
jgi:ABC-type uncharacterized transport system permease subunit